MATFLAACGGSNSSAPAGAPSMAPAYNEAFVAELVANGVPRDDAVFLALASIAVTSGGAKSVRIVETFPTGNTVDMTITLDPNRHPEPDTLEVSYSETDDALAFTLSYFVPFTGMPDDVRQEIETLAASGGAILAFNGTRIPGPMTAAVDGIGVLVDGIVGKAQSDTVGAALDALKERFGINTTKLGLAVTAGEAIQDSLALNEEWAALERQLDELKQCAENPTNPLTQKAYEENPGMKDRLVQEIESARAEIARNMVVSHIGILNELAADGGPKWLGWVIAPGTKWAKETLNDINRERLEQLRRGIPKCGEPCPYGSSAGSGGQPGSGESSGGGGTGGGGSTEGVCAVPIRLVGSADAVIVSFGTVMATLHARDVVWQEDPAAPGSGTYHVVSGTLDWSLPGTWMTTSGGGVIPEQTCSYVPNSGSESLVADDPYGSGGVESDVPFMPGESTLLHIAWRDQPVTYLAQSVIAIHTLVREVCGGVPRGAEVNLNFLGNPRSMSTWIATDGASRAQVSVSGGLLVVEGKYSETRSNGSVEWSWNFTASP